MTATKIMSEAITDEQELRKRIVAIDRKITSQAAHIRKLEAELTEKRNERAALIRQRIDLLQRELPTEEAANG